MSFATFSASLLSLNTLIGCVISTPISLTNHSSQVSSEIVDVMLLYLDSAELFEIIDCFFDFEDIRKFPNFTIKPVTCILVFGQVVQSASQNAVILFLYLLDNNRLYPSYCLIHLKSLE